MKTNFLQKTGSFCLPLFFTVFVLHAQIATWSFNNVLTGNGTANSIPGNASLGSTIAAGGAFNGGTVYYGEGSWPSGALDPNAYLEFSITPSAGHTLTISSLAMQIRRSTTGVSGAGPNNWALRSSLDGYASNISSGVLTTNSTPATTVLLGLSFINLPAKITFRLYGYNATVSSGGLNRFVYDDIVANGSTVLPLAFNYFKVSRNNKAAKITWQLSGEGNLSTLFIERSCEGAEFERIKIYPGTQLEMDKEIEYTDQINNPSGVYAYRIEMISADGQISYSQVQTVFFENDKGFQVQPLNTGGNLVNLRVNTEKSGNYIFSLYNMNGSPVVVKPVQLGTGLQFIQVNSQALKAGIYILVGECATQKISTKILVQ